MVSITFSASSWASCRACVRASWAVRAASSAATRWRKTATSCCKGLAGDAASAIGGAPRRDGTPRPWGCQPVDGVRETLTIDGTQGACADTPWLRQRVLSHATDRLILRPDSLCESQGAVPCTSCPGEPISLESGVSPPPARRGAAWLFR